MLDAAILVHLTHGIRTPPFLSKAPDLPFLHFDPNAQPLPQLLTLRVTLRVS
jgi:hypothetical protein